MGKKQINFNRVKQVPAVNQEMNTKGELVEKNVYTSIVLSEELYTKLKIYTAQKGITVKDFFEFHIDETLTNDVEEKISKAGQIENYFKINLYTSESKRKDLKVWLSKRRVSMRDFIVHVVKKAVYNNYD